MLAPRSVLGELDVSPKMIRLPLITFFLFAFTSCLGFDCTNEVEQELLSPDGTKKVVIFLRNCGATTGYNTQASILESDEDLPNDSGTAFIIDSGSATVSWKSDNELLVIIERSARVFKKEISDRDVTLEYQHK